MQSRRNRSRAIPFVKRSMLGVTAAAVGLLLGCGGGDDDGPTGPAEYSTLTGATKDVAVSFTESTNIAAAPSPDGKRVVFAAQGALWVMPIDGGNATRLTSWEMEPSVPTWSPDGQLIAFQNYDGDGNYHIWTLRPDGSEQRRLTEGPFDDREPAWMPDSSAVVFASDRSDDGQHKIWQVSLAATPVLTQLTLGEGAEGYPAVSPDGRSLAYVEANRIYTRAIGGGAATQVASGTLPTWAADGTLVHHTAARTLKIGSTEVGADEDIFPFPIRFLADGRYLYTADGKIRVRSVDGRETKDIPFSATMHFRRPVLTARSLPALDNTAAQPVRGISSPVISPDGQSIAFIALNDLWWMRIGQPPVRLTSDIARDGTPQFTADGSAVYFVSEKGNHGSMAVDRIDLATQARTRLAAIPAKSMIAPKMSPTGDRIAYLTLGGRLEIWDVAAGTAQTVISGNQPGAPSWSPTGNWIMTTDNRSVSSRFGYGYNELRIIDVAAKTGRFVSVGEAPRQISDREEGAAVLSPDGRKVAFIMDAVLHVMDLKADGSADGAARAITTAVADLPSWAGDSQTLLYKSGTQLKTIRADGSGGRDIAVDLNWSQQLPAGTTVVRAGKLWDGTSDSLRSDVDIVIQGNRITAIQPHDAATAASATKYIDASALTVLPGLIDSHSHPLTLYQGSQLGSVAASMLAYGITSTMSVGGPLHQSIEYKEAVAAGNLLGPRLWVSPPVWEGNRTTWSFSRSLRNAQVADLEIAKARAMGVDFLKAYTRMPIPIMHKVAQAALDMNVPSATHLIAQGAATGIAGTSHLTGSFATRVGYSTSQSGRNIAYQDAVDIHAKGDMWLQDTSFSSQALFGLDASLTQDDRFKYVIPSNYAVPGVVATTPPSAERLAALRNDARQATKVRDAGGLVAIGTDTPLVVPGMALHGRMRAVASVSSNLRALQDVTINPAKMMLADADIGSVAVGKLADLTIVKGNPLDDIKAAADVQYVVRNGLSYALDDIVAPFRTAAAKAHRAKAIAAFGALCAQDVHLCGNADHSD